MKKKLLIKTFLLLTALVLTAHISYGQLKQDSINQYSIKQSIKCFQEQKSLGKIIFYQDSIIQANKYFDSIKNERVIKDFKTIISENTQLKDKNKSLESKVKFLYGIITVETLILLGIIIF